MSPTPSAIDVLRVVASGIPEEARVAERARIILELVVVLEREALDAARRGSEAELGPRHRKMWCAAVDLASDLLDVSGSSQHLLREPSASAWSRLAERAHECIPGLSPQARVEVRSAARLLAETGASDSLEEILVREDEHSLRVQGLLEALTVVARVPEAALVDRLAHDFHEAVVAIAPEPAAAAIRWANELEGRLRFETNMKALADARPELLLDHPDDWVVVADGTIVGFARDLQAAAALAFERFPDGRSLIAPVDERFELSEPALEKWGLGGDEGKD